MDVSFAALSEVGTGKSLTPQGVPSMFRSWTGHSAYNCTMKAERGAQTCKRQQKTSQCTKKNEFQLRLSTRRPSCNEPCRFKCSALYVQCLA